MKLRLCSDQAVSTIHTDFGYLTLFGIFFSFKLALVDKVVVRDITNKAGHLPKVMKSLSGLRVEN